MRRKTGPPEEWPCKVCGKTTLPFDRHSFSTWQDPETDEWKAIAYCSQECKDAEPIECKECGKSFPWGDAYRYEEGSACPPRTGWYHWKNAWCSKPCYTKKEKRDQRRNAIGDVVMYVWLGLPPIIAVSGAVYSVVHFWPDMVKPLLYIMPIYGVIFAVSMFLMNRTAHYSNGTSGPLAMWLIPWGIPYGGICALSFLAFIILNVYTGVSVWLKL
jgi:hypothetical protein